MRWEPSTDRVLRDGERWIHRRPVVTPGVIERRSVAARWRRVKRRAGEWMWRTGRRWAQEVV